MTEEHHDTPDGSIGARARTAAGWQFLSKGINTALQMATTIILARLLMPDDFGIVAMAAMVTGLAVIFQDLGLGQALVQRQEIRDEHIRSAFWGTLVMAMLLYLAVFSSAPHVGAFFGEPRMIPVLKLIALTFVLSPFAVVPRSLLQRDLNFKTPFFAGLASSVAYGGVGITMALLGYSYWALVGASLAGGLTNTVALCILTRYLPPLVPTFGGIRDLYGFGVGVTLSGMFAYLATKADYFVIGRRMDADALGLYTKAFQAIELPTSTLSRVLAPILFPSFAVMQHDKPRLRAAYSKMLMVVSFIGFPGMIVLAIVAPEAIPLIFGEQWTGAVRPLQIMAPVGMFKLLGAPGGAIIKATGRVYLEMWQQIVRVTLLGVGAWYAVRWGIEGVAVVMVITTCISYTISASIVYSATGFGLKDLRGALGGSLIFAILIGLVTFASRHVALTYLDLSMTFVLILPLVMALGCGSAILLLARMRAARVLRVELAGLYRKIAGSMRQTGGTGGAGSAP